MRLIGKFLAVIFGMTLILASEPVPAMAYQIRSAEETIKVTASVRAYTFLIVNNQNQIQKIYNNSDRVGRLAVMQNSLSGPEIVLDKAILSQFKSIEKTINLNHFGWVVTPADSISINSVATYKLAFESLKL